MQLTELVWFCDPLGTPLTWWSPEVGLHLHLHGNNMRHWDALITCTNHMPFVKLVKEIPFSFGQIVGMDNLYKQNSQSYSLLLFTRTVLFIL